NAINMFESGSRHDVAQRSKTPLMDKQTLWVSLCHFMTARHSIRITVNGVDGALCSFKNGFCVATSTKCCVDVNAAIFWGQMFNDLFKQDGDMARIGHLLSPSILNL